MTTLKDHKGILNEADAMKLLEAVSQLPHATDSGRESSTQWSVVYNAAALTAEISMGMNYDQTYTYSLLEE